MHRSLAKHVLLLLIIVWSAGCEGLAPHPGTTSQRRTPGVERSAPPRAIVRPAARHRVVKVHDGDSVTLLSDGVQYKARLSGIDAPELRQEFGLHAKATLVAMVEGRVVTFTDSGLDRYHRTLVRLHVEGMDVNAEMVRRGMAWKYSAYTRDPVLTSAEQEARQFHRGLWSQANPVPPWEWRHAR
ncbi:thermonuclease family protein [Roseimicrobium sp. ORNL1]|uniref:thermonuclease family protein n=1 Tax=Roseimicrobium sp. ORNL1 TaxID=2711231 RepID=UPI0013E0F221|nr:thermonuclease family protein [Roseimicrobium sp. ORNL1]QIF01228.1 thermonuclease family protein [Roseimicrobium sp. ORNL1]